MSLSNTLRHCRLEWRPSTQLQVLHFLLLILALVSIALSAFPGYLQLVAALGVIYSAAFSHRKLHHQDASSLFWRAGATELTVNLPQETQSLSQPRCHRQGPLWIISGLDAALQAKYFVFMPDTLNRKEQRQLHLVATTPQVLE